MSLILFGNMVERNCPLDFSTKTKLYYIKDRGFAVPIWAIENSKLTIVKIDNLALVNPFKIFNEYFLKLHLIQIVLRNYLPVHFDSY